MTLDNSIRWQRRRWLVACAALCALPSCADATTDVADADRDRVLGPRGLMVVGGDYQTTTLSRVDVDTMRREAPAFLHSGSVVGSNGAALSGDVVAGRVVDGSGDALVVDRGRGAITRLDGLTVRWQRGVAPEFAANPQDAIALPGLVVVVRGQRDPAAADNGLGAEAGSDPLAVGDDLVGLSSAGEPRWRLALSSHATIDAAFAMGGSPALDKSRLWLPLGSIAKAFDAVGKGTLLVVDVADAGASIIGSVALPALANCRTARRAGPVDAGNRRGADANVAVVVVCSGAFSDGPAQQLQRSGLAFLRADAQGTTTVTRVVPAAAIGDRPLGFGLATDTTRAFVITLGDLEAGSADALWRVDIDSGAALKISDGSGAFHLSSLWHDDVQRRLWVSDNGVSGRPLGDASSPVGDLRIFDTSGEVVFHGALESNPKGLRALELAPW